MDSIDPHDLHQDLIEDLDMAESLARAGLAGKERRFAYLLGRISVYYDLYPGPLSPAVRKRMQALRKLGMSKRLGMPRAFLSLPHARSPGEAFDLAMARAALDFVYADFSTMSEIMARRAVRNALRDGKRSAFSVRRAERGYDVFLRPAFFPPPEGDRTAYGQNPLESRREAPPFSREARPGRLRRMSDRPFPYMEPLAGRIPRGALLRLWDEAMSRRELPCPRCGASWDAETPFCAACGTNAEIIRHAYAYGDEMPPMPIDLRRLEPLTDATFVEVVQSLDVVIVFFAAPDTCPPCKEMHPIVKDLASEGYPIVLVDIKGDAGDKLMDAYKVEGVPTFITFADGKPLWRRDGPVTRTDLIRDLKDAQAAR